jgi:hypothetical protein
MNDNDSHTGGGSQMIRTLEHKLTTAVDSREWLATLEPSPEINKLLDVLDTTIDDMQRIQRGLAITEVHYYRLQIAKMDAADLLEDHMEDYAAELEGFTVLETPTTIVELIFIVLNDALAQMTGSLLNGRRAKNFTPISEQELNAMNAFGLIRKD